MTPQETQPNAALSDRLTALTRQLEEGVRDVFESGKYARYLDTLSRFHTYSARNTLLIFTQNPDATRVAGFETWKSLGRSVRKGEKGLSILAPAPYKKTIQTDRDGQGRPLLDGRGRPHKKDVEITVPAFKPVKVFDISQTWGEPLPELTRRLEDRWDKDEGTKDEGWRVWSFRAALLRSLQKISPYPVEYESMAQENRNGFCDPEAGRIVVRDNLSQAQTVKTLIHELAHARMHVGESTDRVLAEIQAESVAYVTCRHFGIDASSYSFGYVAGWSQDRELTVLQRSLGAIQKEARGMIVELTAELEIIRTQERTVEQSPCQYYPEAVRPQAPLFQSVTPESRPDAGSFAMEMSKAMITELELDGPRFGPEERELIVGFARRSGDIEATEGMVKELAARGFELKRGFADPIFSLVMEGKIELLQERWGAAREEFQDPSPTATPEEPRRSEKSKAPRSVPRTSVADKLREAQAGNKNEPSREPSPKLSKAAGLAR